MRCVKGTHSQVRPMARFLGMWLVLSLLLASSVWAATTLAPLIDFDGNRKTDVLVAHKSSSTITEISVRCSTTGFLDELHSVLIPDFGNEGDEYFPGDFDGNGKTDLALCRRVSASQYKWSVRYSTTGILNSDSGFTISDYGNDGDFYVVGDWNGDGRDDIALARLQDSNYKWNVCYSTADGILKECRGWVLTHGRPGDRFYVGDFDGDGHSDLLVARMSDPLRISWSVCYSATGLPTTWGGWVLDDFGKAYDEFYVGDFDGNGKSDLAIARQINPYDMIWGVRYSTTGVFNKWSGWTSLTEVGNDYMVSDYDGDGVHEITVNNYASSTAVKWGAYETTDLFMDTWRGWMVPSFGEQEDKFIPADSLRNTIDQFAVREVGVSDAYSPTLVDYYCAGTFLPAATEPWCSEFVSWCYHRAGNSFTGGTRNPRAPWLLHGHGTVTNWFQDNAYWWDNSTTLPVTLKPGDYVKTQNSAGVGHSRMVERIIGGNLYTVEGNASSRVRKKTLTNYLADTNVLGFGRLYDVDREDWCVRTSPTTNYLKGVAFRSGTLGVAVGLGGVILRTTNGGSTWTRISNPADSTWPLINLNNVIWNGTVYVAVGHRGTILVSDDNGLNWISKTSGTGNDLYGVAFYDSLKGVAVGELGTVLYTSDGGSVWDTGTSPVTNTLYGAAWVNSSKAFAVGSSGRILKSTNSGQAWRTVTAPSRTPTLRSVAFTTSSHGWAVGNGGTILYTDDGGATWEKQTSGTGETLFDVCVKGFHDAHSVGNNGTILHTEDGVTWAKQTSGEIESFYSVFQTSFDNIWAVGSNGLVLRASHGGHPLD